MRESESTPILSSTTCVGALKMVREMKNNFILLLLSGVKIVNKHL